MDIKIDEILDQQKQDLTNTGNKRTGPLKFIILFILLFPLFYYFNIWFFSITSPGALHYNAFIAAHFNYISGLRELLLACSARVLGWFGFPSIYDEYHLLVAGHGNLQLVYSCLGLGVVSFFAAFVLSYPAKLKPKIILLICGIAGIEILNIARFVLLGLFWDKKNDRIIDHHTIFNITIYVIIAITLYFWVKYADKLNTGHETN